MDFLHPLPLLTPRPLGSDWALNTMQLSPMTPADLRLQYVKKMPQVAPSLPLTAAAGSAGAKSVSFCGVFSGTVIAPGRGTCQPGNCRGYNVSIKIRWKSGRICQHTQPGFSTVFAHFERWQVLKIILKNENFKNDFEKWKVLKITLKSKTYFENLKF